jgi:hypothetical protein
MRDFNRALMGFVYRWIIPVSSRILFRQYAKQYSFYDAELSRYTSNPVGLVLLKTARFWVELPVSFESSGVL